MQNNSSFILDLQNSFLSSVLVDYLTRGIHPFHIQKGDLLSVNEALSVRKDTTQIMVGSEKPSKSKRKIGLSSAGIKGRRR